MPFPASQSTNHDAWLSLTRSARDIRNRVQTLRDLSAAGPVRREYFIQQQKALTEALTSWAAVIAEANNASLQAYARDQVNDPTLDIAASYVAMRDAAIDLRQWIFDNIPRDAGTGAVLVYTTTLEGEVVPITVTTAQTSVYRTKADAFIATIS